MNHTLKWVLASSTVALAAQAAAQVTFYEAEGFRGRAFTTAQAVDNFERRGFNDRASSAVVDRGSWEVCDDAGFGGRCRVLRKGSYDTLQGLGMSNRISSVRPVSNSRRYDNETPAPLMAPNYEYRRRPNERVYEATVTSVHAVMGPAGQRCWMERQQVSDGGRGDANVGGALLGGLLGGVLGHQIGGGTGRDIATAGGVVAGAMVGANAGRDNNGGYERNVRHCETTASGPPQYWDVSYDYRGTTHQVQMASAPGRTIAVNSRGEPRQ